MDNEYIKLLEQENDFRKSYNELSKKNSPHEAVSTLMQIKTGIEDQIKVLDQQALHIAERKKETDEETFIDLFKEKIEWVIEDLEIFERHFQAVNMVISFVIRESFPKELGIYTQEEIENKAQLKNLGRPLDSTAPQELIEQKVKELSNKKEFQSSNGIPKPTTIRDYIQNNLPELQGELSSRALFSRVKKALKN